jgi:hypothetical protein
MDDKVTITFTRAQAETLARVAVDDLNRMRIDIAACKMPLPPGLQRVIDSAISNMRGIIAKLDEALAL